MPRRPLPERDRRRARLPQQRPSDRELRRHDGPVARAPASADRASGDYSADPSAVRGAVGPEGTSTTGGKLRGSLRSPALRAVALASGITLLGGASAHAAVDQKVTASKAVAQSCHAHNLNGAAGTQSVTATAPDTGLIRARLSGGGDWDLGVFDANSGRFVAGSASFGSNELAEGFVKGGQKLRRPGLPLPRRRVERRPVGGLRRRSPRSPPARCRSSTSARHAQGQGRPAGARPRPHRARRQELRRGRAARPGRRARRCATPASPTRSGSPTSRRSSKADRDKDAKFAASNPKTQLPSAAATSTAISRTTTSR